MKIIQTSNLIVGTGIAGLSYALEASKKEEVMLICKTSPFESGSAMAMGGVAAAVGSGDNWLKHYRDTLESGAYCSERKVAMSIIKSGPDSVQDLINHGCRFDRYANGELELGQEGGHSFKRIVHRADQSGKEIISRLLESCHKRKNIQILENIFAKDLITHKQGDKTICSGILAYDMQAKSEINICSNNTLLCTGGAGQLYSYSTNPHMITGDGYAMAIRAGIKLRDMSFVQFHPTVWINKAGKPVLISEAIRGAGAVLRNANGERFMHKYALKQELATRDVVARAIVQEMALTKSDYVYLDMRDIPPEKLQAFSGFIAECKKEDLDPSKVMINVKPAAHYFCGGILTGSQGETEIKGLYATGEVASTGLHGANRLASNSLLEAWVMGKRCFEYAQKVSQSTQIDSIVESINVKSGFDRAYLQRLMELYAGIIKTNKGLQMASSMIEDLFRNLKLGNDIAFSKNEWENYNLLTIAGEVITDARKQERNLGVFYNSDLS